MRWRGVVAVGVVFAFAMVGLRAVGDEKLKEGTFLPTGLRITPDAARGSIFQPLNPGLAFDPAFTVGQAVSTVISPDGKTLLILTSGYNVQNFTSGPKKGQPNPEEANEYVFVLDISGAKPVQKQVLQVRNTLDGIAFNPSGTEFYVSGGPDDDAALIDRGLVSDR